jgi:hypothetical protein
MYIPAVCNAPNIVGPVSVRTLVLAGYACRPAVFFLYFSMPGSANRLLVDNDRLRYAAAASTNREPLDGVLVEEGPRRDDGNEGEGGATEGNVDRELDVLQDIADDKGDGLRYRCQGRVSKKERLGC